ncbi:MAG: bacillithiol system redox-active protein YtxJ [Bacteroidota bacterium]
MAKVTTLHTPDDLQAVLDASQDGPVALLKTSIACPISARGQEQFVQLENDADPPLYGLVVQYARPLSNHIAETLGVEHQTPQAIVIHEGEAVFHASHHHITAGRLRDAARRAVGEPTVG